MSPITQYDEALDPSLDRDALDAIKAVVSTDIFKQLLARASSDIARTAADCVRAAAATDWQAAEREAHSLKSVARTFGAPILGQMAADIETRCGAADSHPNADMLSALDALQAQTDITLGALDRLLSSL